MGNSEGGEMSESLQDQLIRHEGIRTKPYRDTVGKLTIGVGRNLDDVGIFDNEIRLMLINDIARATQNCRDHIDFFNSLDTVRQNVLINMCFNLGINGLLKFHNTLQAIKEGRYTDAAEDMLASKWAEQVGKRAVELSKLMKETL